MEGFKSLSLNQRNIAGHSWISGHCGQAYGVSGTTFITYHRIYLGKGLCRHSLCHWLQENSYIHYSSHNLFCKTVKTVTNQIILIYPNFYWNLSAKSLSRQLFHLIWLCLLVLEAYHWCPLFYFLSPVHPFIYLSLFLP